MLYFLASIIAGYALASILGSDTSHHATTKKTGASTPITIPTVPDTACGGPAALGKPAITVSVNGVPYVAELDSGASAAFMTSTTAAATKLTTLPKADVQNISFTGQAAANFQGYKASLIIPGLPPLPVTIYTGAQIGCNLLPTAMLEQQYIISLSLNSVTFTHV